MTLDEVVLAGWVSRLGVEAVATAFLGYSLMGTCSQQSYDVISLAVE